MMKTTEALRSSSNYHNKWASRMNVLGFIAFAGSVGFGEADLGPNNYSDVKTSAAGLLLTVATGFIIGGNAERTIGTAQEIEVERREWEASRVELQSAAPHEV